MTYVFVKFDGELIELRNFYDYNEALDYVYYISHRKDIVSIVIDHERNNEK